jgi:hypothetical protein
MGVIRRMGCELGWHRFTNWYHVADVMDAELCFDTRKCECCGKKEIRLNPKRNLFHEGIQLSLNFDYEMLKVG